MANVRYIVQQTGTHYEIVDVRTEEVLATPFSLADTRRLMQMLNRGEEVVKAAKRGK